MDAEGIRHRLELGLAARRAGQLAVAEANFVTAASTARELTELGLLSQALAGLGQVARDRGQVDQATIHYSEALTLARTHVDPLQVAHIARHLGDMLLHHDQAKRAEPFLREAVAIERADPCTPQLELANCLRTVGHLEIALGNHVAARALLTEARTIYNTLELTAGVTDCDDRLSLLP